MPTKEKDMRFEMRINIGFRSVIGLMQQDPNWKMYNTSQIIDRLVAQQGIKMGMEDIYLRITEGEDWRLKFKDFSDNQD